MTKRPVAGQLSEEFLEKVIQSGMSLKIAECLLPSEEEGPVTTHLEKIAAEIRKGFMKSEVVPTPQRVDAYFERNLRFSEGLLCAYDMAYGEPDIDQLYPEIEDFSRIGDNEIFANMKARKILDEARISSSPSLRREEQAQTSLKNATDSTRIADSIGGLLVDIVGRQMRQNPEIGLSEDESREFAEILYHDLVEVYLDRLKDRVLNGIDYAAPSFDLWKP